MINYSVFLLPNPQDSEAAPKAYAKAQVSDVMSFRAFVQHIADHGGHKRGTVKGVLSDMCECLVEMLLEGKKVQLDELGDFWLSLTSTGAENCQKFTAANITGLNILFTPGADFENLIDRAEFNPVASRVAQVATLKAEKAGIGIVDIKTAKGKKPTTDDTTGGTDDSGNTGDGDGGLE
ncbi:MAG: HU family DNA-binding protein [Bacteroidaceae bacterium]